MGETKHSTGALSRRDDERKYLQVLVANLARCIVSARDAERKYLSRVARWQSGSQRNEDIWPIRPLQITHSLPCCN